MSDVIVRVGETENASIGIDEQGTIKGEDGVTFYPNVNEYGVISWTNDGNRQNPQPVNITGPQGAQGLPAISGVVQFGFDLPTPASNYDGQNWLVQDDFTRLMVLYRSENGEWVDIGSIRGANGTPGINGEDGFSPAVWVLPIEGGHEVIVTDETGSTTFNVMDGVKGEKGDKGDRGDMPFWFGTRAEYNALQTLDPDVCYCIEEGT